MAVRNHIAQTIASSWLCVIATSVAQLLMVPIALSSLSKAEFALFAIISQAVTMIMLAEMGARSAASRLLIDSLAKGRDAYNKTWTATIFVFGCQALVMFLLVLAMVPLLGIFFELDESQLAMARKIFLAVGAVRVGGYLFSVFPTALFAGQKLKDVNTSNVYGTVVQLIVFGVAIWQSAGLWAYPLALLLAQIVISGLQYRKARQSGLIGRVGRATVDLAHIKVLFFLGIDVFLASVFGAIMGNSLLLLSGNLLTLEETAILAVNLKLVSLMTQLLQRIPGSATPALMKMESEKSDHQFHVWWKLLTKLTIFATILCGGGFVLWNRLIVTFWASGEMILDPFPIVLLSLIPFRYLFHNQFVGSLTIFKEIRKVNLWLLWEIILYLVLATYLGNRFGLNGLLAANLLSLAGGASIGGIKWMAFYMKLPGWQLATLALRVVLPLSLLFLMLIFTLQHVSVEGMISVILMSIVWTIAAGATVYSFVLDGKERARLSELWMARSFLRR
jgi:O-antigen/teichoic acid export membrane protein